jgi:ribosomal protein S18 acetylase RimI-like enzyme
MRHRAAATYAALMALSIVPLEAEHLDVAAGILARRQARLRESSPFLPERYTDPEATRPLLQAALEAPEAYGVLGLQDGEPFAYLVGTSRHEPIWNRAAWSPIEGAAIEPDADPDLMRDLYAVWSKHWVERGFFWHYVHAPAADEWLQSVWFDLNFGKMQAHAVRDVDLTALEPRGPLSFEVRRLAAHESELLEPLYDLIARHQVQSPAYAITLPERYAVFEHDFREDLADEESHYWAAFEAGVAIGLAGFYEMHPGIRVPGGALELGVAMTAPEARGRGVQRALLRAGLEAARAAGASHCVTDWRTANLLSSRSWTRLGFRPTHFRLHRAVDPRVAWAARHP